MVHQLDDASSQIKNRESSCFDFHVVVDGGCADADNLCRRSSSSRCSELPANDVAHSYMDDVIALVLGSFILALAVEHYNIHRRLALNHVVAQRGSHSDDDAGGNWNLAAAAVGHRGYILRGDWRNEYVDGDRCQPDIGGDVEEKGSSRSLSAYLDKAHLKRELDLLANDDQKSFNSVTNGDWHIIKNPKDPKIVEIGKFAVAEADIELEGRNYKLIRVKSGVYRVENNGITYKLVLVTVEDGVVEDHNATVFDNPKDIRARKLFSSIPH
ncbi:hypothetical protein HAX54_002441 [Datura stramonium]|uniref:Cystatin domain-containing protein n=1 Tax=Datura stramonium TaxID=4076 RepID=A0ABS8T3X7_DATST|nr:hypothetical protein [Datura stramonium]